MFMRRDTRVVEPMFLKPVWIRNRIPRSTSVAPLWTKVPLEHERGRSIPWLLWTVIHMPFRRTTRCQEDRENQIFLDSVGGTYTQWVSFLKNRFVPTLKQESRTDVFQAEKNVERLYSSWVWTCTSRNRFRQLIAGSRNHKYFLFLRPNRKL